MCSSCQQTGQTPGDYSQVFIYNLSEWAVSLHYLFSWNVQNVHLILMLYFYKTTFYEKSNLFINMPLCFSLYIIPSSLLHAWDIPIIAMANTDQIIEKRIRQLPQLVIGAIIYFFAFLTKKVNFLSKRTQTYIVWGIVPCKTPYQFM